MKESHCLALKFKKSSISEEKYHAHLFIQEKEIYIEIIEKKQNSDIDKRFMLSEKSLGLFEENFEVLKCDFELLFENSRIYKITNLIDKESYSYFTIYLTSICIIKPNSYRQDVDEGIAFLNSNGLKMVNLFYSFFSNIIDKNIFEISRMDNMYDYYKIGNLKFRPELNYISNERRGSESFEIKKIPIIKFSYVDFSYKDVKENIGIICKFLSFCLGIRIQYHRLIYRTSESIYIYVNTEKIDDVYVSSLSVIFNLLKENYKIEKILKTDWHINYIANKSKFDKAIDNILHSREVESSSKYLLLFNIIEIFNQSQNEEKFEVNNLKTQNISKARNLLEETLANSQDVESFRKKWEGIVNRVFIKPLNSPLEETLRSNGIDTQYFGFSFNQLKKVRDKITHGSVSSIDEETLKEYIYAIRKISICLMLSKLGFNDELKND